MCGSNWIAAGGLAVAALSLAKDFFQEKARAKREVDLKKFEVSNAAALKKYEVTFLQKRQTFAELFKALRSMRNAAAAHQPREQLNEAYAAEVDALHGLLPFLPKSDHSWLADRIGEIEDAVDDIWSAAPSPSPFSPGPYTDYTRRVTALRAELFTKLFPD